MKQWIYSIFFPFSGIFLLLIIPNLLVHSIGARLLRQFGFHSLLVNITGLLLPVNALINPIYYFVKLDDVREAFKTLCMRKNSNNQAGNEVALNVIAMNAMWTVGVCKVRPLKIKSLFWFRSRVQLVRISEKTHSNIFSKSIEICTNFTKAIDFLVKVKRSWELFAHELSQSCLLTKFSGISFSQSFHLTKITRL